jgi:hypothetical protein
VMAAVGRNKWRVRRGLSGLLADCGIPGAFVIDATEDR